MKKPQRSQRFKDNDELQEAVLRQRMCSTPPPKPKDWLHENIRKLPERWQRCSHFECEHIEHAGVKSGRRTRQWLYSTGKPKSFVNDPSNIYHCSVSVWLICQTFASYFIWLRPWVSVFHLVIMFFFYVCHAFMCLFAGLINRSCICQLGFTYLLEWETLYAIMLSIFSISNTHRANKR